MASMAVLFCMYFPTAAVAYFSLGTCVKDNVILSMSDGGLKTAAECVILLHLVAALPIIINPPSQFFEEMLHIPKGRYVFFVLLSSLCISKNNSRVQLETMRIQNNINGHFAIHRRIRAFLWKHFRPGGRKHNNLPHIRHATCPLHHCHGPFGDKVLLL